MNDFGVLKVHPNAKYPTKANDKARCWDFYTPETVTFKPGELKRVDLGIKVVLPDGFDLVLEDRSGMAFRGSARSGGQIDNDYRGNIAALIRWFPTADVTSDDWDDATLTIEAGDRIIQGVLEKKHDQGIKVIGLTTEQFDAFADTERGEGGFGSTGN